MMEVLGLSQSASLNPIRVTPFPDSMLSLVELKTGSSCDSWLLCNWHQNYTGSWVLQVQQLSFRDNIFWQPNEFLGAFSWRNTHIY